MTDWQRVCASAWRGSVESHWLWRRKKSLLLFAGTWWQLVITALMQRDVQEVSHVLRPKRKGGANSDGGQEVEMESVTEWEHV